jgi:hypothetical protein
MVTIEVLNRTGAVAAATSDLLAGGWTTSLPFKGSTSIVRCRWTVEGSKAAFRTTTCVEANRGLGSCIAAK